MSPSIGQALLTSVRRITRVRELWSPSSGVFGLSLRGDELFVLSTWAPREAPPLPKLSKPLSRIVPDQIRRGSASLYGHQAEEAALDVQSNSGLVGGSHG